MAHYNNADFEELYRAESTRTKALTPKSPKWEDVVHFVILPNYKEDLPILRLAIDSVARSKIARTQICLVLAMEEREEGSRGKADTLIQEFESSFRGCLATYHPVDLPGDVPGKSANTKWAARRVLEEIMPSQGLSIMNCVFTVGDADSQFHDEYFAALTYHYIFAGAPDGKTPTRFHTIWQPPIVHYKNYHTQPLLVRLSSYITTCHELGNGASPRAVRVPYSTYSISANLANAVGGWDPDFISEDWHMFLKCFFATGGQARIFPIFLPVMNYAVQDDNCWKTMKARFVQAKRHALGFSELVYFNEQFPRIFRLLQTRREKVEFSYKAVFLWVKLLMIHVIMGTFVFIAPMNALLITYFVKHDRPQDLNLNSWAFLVNCVGQTAGILAPSFSFISAVEIYYSLQHKIDGHDDPNLPIWWRWKPLHMVLVIVQSGFMVPVLFMAMASEWIAAVKCVRTHKFRYIVASKPTLAPTNSSTNQNGESKHEASP